jgi:LysR family glycine cleavage system transcriptional activator
MARAHLPTTTGMRVVAALAQHGTVSAAAQALNLTQSAVSKQIKGVEDLVGMTLFTRTSRGLTPTEAGVIYIQQARVALGALETAAARVASLRSSRPALRLHVLPILGDRWFMPRFSGFVDAHPEIEVQFTIFAASDTLEEADVVFQFGDGNWQGWKADYFLGREVILVGAPPFISRGGGIRSPEDVGHFPVLEHVQTPLRWKDFAAECGLNDFHPERTIRLGYYSLVIRAAISGQGLALVPRSLILDELKSGQLVNPLSLGFTSANCYWLTTRIDRPRHTDLAVFCDWALEEARKTELQVPDRSAPGRHSSTAAAQPPTVASQRS